MNTRSILTLAAAGLAALCLFAAVRGFRSAAALETNPPATLAMNEVPSADPAKATSEVPLPGGPAIASRETAILAGGCFWGMEEILRKIPGVVETSVGYIGGTTASPTYKEICTGTTGHAEGIRIVFESRLLPYEELLGYFFRMHDPTTLNRQHNDVGTQYRSAIFYTTEEQKEVAERVKAQVGKSGGFKRPIVTEITRASTFHRAEDYHQEYLVKNPGGYNCHILRD